MNKDTIYRGDAIKAIEDRRCWLSLASQNGDMGRVLWDEYYIKHEDAIDALLLIPSADRPQGYWIKTDVATYRCSECGKMQIADDESELNFCCCCGSRNKVRRLKGADDE